MKKNTLPNLSSKGIPLSGITELIILTYKTVLFLLKSHYQGSLCLIAKDNRCNMRSFDRHDLNAPLFRDFFIKN